MGELLDELREHIYITYANAEPAERKGAQWIMDPEWLPDLLELAGWRYGHPETLLGLSFDTRDGAGPPHLEPVRISNADA